MTGKQLYNILFDIYNMLIYSKEITIYDFYGKDKNKYKLKKDLDELKKMGNIFIEYSEKDIYKMIYNSYNELKNKNQDFNIELIFDFKKTVKKYKYNAFLLNLYMNCDDFEDLIKKVLQEDYGILGGFIENIKSKIENFKEKKYKQMLEKELELEKIKYNKPFYSRPKNIALVLIGGYFIYKIIK